MAEELKEIGVIRAALDISFRQAELAIIRMRPLTVQRCIGRIESLIPQLAKDLGASDAFKKLCDKVGFLKIPTEQWQFDSASAVIEQLDEDVEMNLVKLNSAKQQFPDSKEITLELANVYKQLYRYNEADTVLKEFTGRPNKGAPEENT
jgi:hypothetical protein